MKTFLISIICFVMTLLSFAQKNTVKTEHMTFKGVPINGTLNEFVTKMKQSGFTLIGTENGVATLNGDFSAYKDCKIGVATLKGKDLVSKVTVIFPQQKSWPLLSSNYYNLKEMLTEKYGKPFKIVEKFDITSKPENDNDRMHAVILDKCKYNTTYELENGSIQISIEHNRFMGGFVMLTYLDKINSEILRQKAIDDL